MASTLRIDRRFRGPPSSGNGGYVAGLLARELGGFGCEVTLKAPPPLNEDLLIEHTASGSSLWAGDQCIAEAARADISVTVPAPPSIAEADDAVSRFTGFCDHVFPGCFVCGPERAVGDGLRIFPGSIEKPEGAVASTWEPDSSLADDNGFLRSQYVWAALDCPGYFAIQKISGPAVLGRIGVALYHAAVAGNRMVVTGWPIENVGRKHTVGTALHDKDGKLVAAAKAIWISISASDWQV